MEDHTEAKPAKRQKRERLDFDPVHPQPGPPAAPYTPQDLPSQTHHPAPRPSAYAEPSASRPPQGPLLPNYHHPGPSHPPPQHPGPPTSYETSGHRLSLEFREAQDQKVRSGYQDPRPAGYAPPVTHPQRSYSYDGPPPGSYSAAPSPSPPVPQDQHRRSFAAPAGHEPHAPVQAPMDQPQPPGYGPSVSHHPSHMANGYPVAAGHEQYSAPYQHNASHPPTPIAPSGGSLYYHSNYTSTYNPPTKKKQIRATQACNECRQRKQKCDEQHPCQFCRENGKSCEYKEVPASKQDRSQLELLNGIKSVQHAVDELAPTLHNIEAHLAGHGQRLIAIPKTESHDDSDDPMDMHETNDSPPSSDFDFQISSFLKHEQQAHVFAQNLARAYKKLEVDYMTKCKELVEQGKEITRLECLFANGENKYQMAVPPNHTTGVHHLMKWKFINQLFQNAGITNPNYVWQMERDRGVLRIYGQGEGSDRGDGAHDREDYPTPVSNAASPAYAPTPYPRARGEENGSNASSPQEGLWGYGSSTPMSRSTSEYKHTAQGNEGGLLPNGRLNLDPGEIRGLRDSYYRHMHILHPFLDPQRLNVMIEEFIRKYSPATVNSPATPFAVPGMPQGIQMSYKAGVNSKRRHDGSIVGTPESGDIVRHKYGKLEHSISNAIVLMVLAIGKICLHSDPLPAVVGPSRSQANMELAMTVSPTPSNITISSMLSPGNDGRSILGARRDSADSAAPPPKTQKNADVLPGLAYYAKASDFLGNVNGGTDVSHGQAKLLAGLYMGQLGRAKESWKWIQEACTISRILVMENKEAQMSKTQVKLQPPTPVHTEAHQKKILLLFWSCILSESDIRAEFSDLPDSGLSQYEEEMEYPMFHQNPSGLPDGVHVHKIGLYFSAQIYIRKTLNEVHRTLYTSTEKEFYPKEKWLDIVQWQTSLHDQLKWSVDDSEPANEVNDARLRGKYYGGVYICSRPFLDKAVNHMHGAELPEHWENIPSTIRVNSKNTDNLTDIIAACKLCIWAAKRSTKAFDGLTDERFRKRWILTNIPGTVTAQFGNMLVLTAAYKSWLRPLIDGEELKKLLARTIAHQRSLRPILPYMDVHIKVLNEALKEIGGPEYPPPASSNHSFTSSIPT